MDVIRQIKTDAMSGGETDDDSEAAQGSRTNEKAIIRVPVRWLNPQVVEMLHTVDTWMQFEEDESLAKGEDEDRRGNRPLKKTPGDKPAVVGKVTPALPRNWYEDVWFKSLSPGKQATLAVKPNKPIPNPVRTNIALLMAINRPLFVASLFKASIGAGQCSWRWYSSFTAGRDFISYYPRKYFCHALMGLGFVIRIILENHQLECSR